MIINQANSTIALQIHVDPFQILVAPHECGKRLSYQFSGNPGIVKPRAKVIQAEARTLRPTSFGAASF